tara:strand:+ start:4682 stop:5134 length:453 start_codon:yes stop_codon:yes gene_type:complete
MGFWKESNKEKLAKITKDVQWLVENDPDFSVLMIASGKNEGQSLVHGNAAEILRGLFRTADDNPLFRTMLKDLVKKLHLIDDEKEDVVKGKSFDEIIEKLHGKRSSEFKLNDGTKGSISVVRPEDLSDEDIDNMIRNILGSKDEEGESEG